MTGHVVNVRGWPGRAGWRPPLTPKRSGRLSARVTLVVFAAADLGAEADTFGLGAVLVCRGASLFHALLVVPDALSAERRAELENWAAGRQVRTVLGTLPWRVVGLGEWCDPKATVERAPWAFTPRAYTGGSPVVGYDLGRFFGLAAEHVGARSGTERETWKLWLPGWGERRGGKVRNVSPHRPVLYLRARRAGWQLAFGRPKWGYGKVVDGRSWEGEFVDLASLCYALDADRGGGFSDHRRHFGLEPTALPLAVNVDSAGAGQVAVSVEAVRELALAADAEAGRWFTTRADRAEKLCRVDPGRTQSPAALAQRLVCLARVSAPLAQFDLSDEEHSHWAEAFHGGWAYAEPGLLARPVPVVAADMASCFPLVAHHLGWWDLGTAEGLGREDVSEELRSLCEQVAAGPGLALDPATWGRFGFTLAEVRPEGERFMVEVEDERRPDGRTECVALPSGARSAWYSWPDVVAAAALSGRAPEVVSAVRLVPEGRQADVRRWLPLLPGTVLDLSGDPVPAIVGRRRAAKSAAATVAERRLANTLHALVNSLVSGNPSRLDPTWLKTAAGWRRWERPGPSCFMPVAVSVQAGAHLLLAVLERLVADRGGVIAYRDTDSSFIVASPAGGRLADRRLILTWAEVDEVLAAFEALSPEAAWPVWKSERGTPDVPLQTVVFGPKRHIEFIETGDGPDLADFTEANLAGQFIEPPAMPGRAEDGHYEWVRAVALREVRYALAQRDAQGAAREALPWATGRDFPSLRRLPVATPQALAALPASLGARPGSYYLATTPYYKRDGEAVTLDRGADLSAWQHFPWVGRASGKPVSVVLQGEPFLGATASSGQSTEAERLSSRAADWARPPRQVPITEVTLDPLLVQHVGRVSGVLDADELALPGGLDVHRPRYDEAQRLVALHAMAKVMGKRAFQRRTGLPATVAERAVAGRPVSQRNVAKALRALRADDGPARVCALDGCDHRVFQARALYCSCRDHPSHQDLAKKRRRRARNGPLAQQKGSAP